MRVGRGKRELQFPTLPSKAQRRSVTFHNKPGRSELQVTRDIGPADDTAPDISWLPVWYGVEAGPEKISRTFSFWVQSDFKTWLFHPPTQNFLYKNKTFNHLVYFWGFEIVFFAKKSCFYFSFTTTTRRVWILASYIDRVRLNHQT